jgi:hypothetical protein
MAHRNGIGLPGMYNAPRSKAITINVDGTDVKVTKKFWYGNHCGFNCVVHGVKIFINALESDVAAQKAKEKFDRVLSMRNI